jgi:hypothetical protein
VLLHKHHSPQVRRRWLELAREIVRINPALLRGIIQRLAFLEDEDQLPGSLETRSVLTRLLNGEDVTEESEWDGLEFTEVKAVEVDSVEEYA